MEFIEEAEDEVGLRMDSMMDCVFLLLLYFMCSAQIIPEEKYLGLMMPGGVASTTETLPAELTLAITETGQILCNELEMDTPGSRQLPQLKAKLTQCLEMFGEKQPVVIHPGPEVRQQRVIDVVNACAAVGVKNLSFYANF
ncbi:MAG: biopolymer transporter ExbD [Lentisphaerae bacterium]|jgi:biopolymer transport protein ExbD|nr:biopolymer transporter ExbD [Lentisphaerota bacterium]